jgi:GNAT superfamily N-acetyltransferase
MTAPQHAEPFGAAHYDLATETSTPRQLRLAPVPREEARRLAEAFASIDPWAKYGYAPERLAAFFSIAELSAPRFAIYDGDEIAGVVGLRLDWLRGPFLQFLGILPPAQGRGFGSSVMDWIEREARRGAHRNLWVTASEFNSRALSLYKHHGYEQVALLDGLVSDEHAEILFRKRLF